MSDGLLLCRVHAQESGVVAVNLALIDPLSTQTLLNVQRAGAHTNLVSLVSSAARQLAADWLERRSAGSARPAPPLAETALAEAETREMRPAYQGPRHRLESGPALSADGEAHGALANAFVGTGRLRQAGAEINLRLGCLGHRRADGGPAYFGSYRWAVIRCGRCAPVGGPP